MLEQNINKEYNHVFFYQVFKQKSKDLKNCDKLEVFERNRNKQVVTLKDGAKYLFLVLKALT